MKRILCSVFAWMLLTNAASGQEVNFAEHIAPLLYKNCAPCHHEGTAAPFSLLTYEDAAKRAKMILQVTERRYMPPWKADPSYRSFANEKVLTDKEIDLIRQWVSHDMPKGSKRKMPPVPDFTNGSIVRKPDYVMNVQKPYTIKGDGKENFILFIIPFEFDKEYNVEAIEYLSSKLKNVHHANFGIYAVDPDVSLYGDSSAINANDLMMHANRQAELTRNIVYYNGWVPGATPISFPKGIGFKMPKRGVIVLTNHYAPASVDTEERSSLNFFFTPTEITRTVKTLSIGSGGVGDVNPPLILFPNEKSKFRIQMEIVEPLSLLYVWPHMHLLGKSYTSFIATAERDTIPLVKIKNWDFKWQEAYKFKTMVPMFARSVLTVVGEYDNTSNNPNNPFSPPQVIFSDGLMGTKNEMLSLIIVYLPYQIGDEKLTLH